ncbi:MAG: DUF192 domain-containing protein [Actinomycetota bacterium]|nr:DUF192 domain-containing protein [Actinomycetota bacterium]
MRKVLLAILCAALLVAPACGGDEQEPSSESSRGVSKEGFPLKTAIIETNDEPVMLTVEVAETDEDRARGLMGRTSLPDDQGMVFIFFEEHFGGFWMKNTLIPLSIAFFDQDGAILDILDMKPCQKDPCPTYDPGVSYWGALEVNRGAFEDWGVSVGDRVRMN